MNEFVLNIGADVFCRDGKCGKLAKYAINPKDWLVARLIIEDGLLLKRGRVFPFSTVEWATADEIQLSIDADELPKYPEYREEIIEKPAPEPVQGAALAGSMPYGHTAASPAPPVRERVRYGVPEELTVIERGTPINGLDGRVGKDDHFVVKAANGEITYLVVQQGLLFGNKRLIPVSAVEAISEAAVSVAATEEVLLGLPHYESQGDGEQETRERWEVDMEDAGGPAEGVANSERDRTTRVSMALMEDPRTSDVVIEVIDERGVITLQGEVEDLETREAAVAIAAEQSGVISVINALQVKQ